MKPKRKTKKLFLLALAAMVLALFASCSQKNDGGGKNSGENGRAGNTGEGQAGDEKPFDGLPEKDYGQYEFRVMVQAGDTNFSSEMDFVTQETSEGEAFNDAVSERNRKIEERFNIRLKITPEPYSKMTGTVTKTMASGDDEWDLFLPQMVQGGIMALKGCFLPINSLPFIDLGKPWWDGQVNEAYRIGNDVMFANGAMSPWSFLVTSAMAFNKNLFVDRGIPFPYETVKNGKWTLDEMTRLIKGAYQDLNANGKMDFESDFFGCVGFILGAPYDFYYGAAGMIVKHDENNMPILTDIDGKMVSIVEKTYDIFFGGDCFLQQRGDEQGLDEMTAAFTDGRSLLSFISLNETRRKFREMENDYGLVPVPKFDEAQPDYLSFVNGAGNMVAIPKTVADLERTGIVTEGIASLSHDIVKPALYEITLKIKGTRDEDSEQMIDIIAANRVFDIGYTYMLPGYGPFMRDLMAKRSKDVISHLERQTEKAKKELESIVEAYQSSK